MLSILAAANAAAAPITTINRLEAAAIVHFVNDSSTTLEELDLHVGLDRRAASALVARRPFTTLSEIDAIPYVGPVALRHLLRHATTERGGRSTPKPLPTPRGTGPEKGGTFDYVHFDEATARVALAIINKASFAELSGWGTLWSRSAKLIVAGRPFASLEELANTPGVGMKTMQTLHRFASTGWRSLDGECVLRLARVTPPEVRTYDTYLKSYDPRHHGTRYRMKAWRLPPCVALDDDRMVEVLLRDIIAATGLTGTWTRSPALTRIGKFPARLASSFDEMRRLRDTYAAAGAIGALAAFDRIADSFASVSRLLETPSPTARELTTTITTETCTREVVVVTGLEEGLVLAIWGGESCATE